MVPPNAIGAGQFVEWAVNNNIFVHMNPHVATITQAREWGDIPVWELTELTNAIQSLASVAEQQLQYITEEQAADLDSTVEKITYKLAQTQGYHSSRKRLEIRQNPSLTDQLKEGLNFAATSLRKIEFIVQDFDGDELGGFAHQTIFEPIAKAQAKKNDITDDMMKRIKAAFDERNAQEQARLTEIVKFNGREFTRSELIAMALNTGNTGNLQKLSDGYAATATNPNIWHQDVIMGMLDRELSDSDWVMVQKIWDIIDELYEPLYDVQKKATGIPPGKVPATPPPLRSDKVSRLGLKGGYYPVKYDADRKVKSFLDEQRGKANLFENNFMTPKASTGAVEARQEYSAPIRLSLDVIPEHINEVTHFVTHYGLRAWARYALRRRSMSKDMQSTCMTLVILFLIFAWPAIVVELANAGACR